MFETYEQAEVQLVIQLQFHYTLAWVRQNMLCPTATDLCIATFPRFDWTFHHFTPYCIQPDSVDGGSIFSLKIGANLWEDNVYYHNMGTKGMTDFDQ